ncbi:helix-turn-helix transcriptional regulator [Erysipelothrix rhusiopathiae]|uniref:helix-turn-helix transcriptional regulator n=1 Tax=Erysipelothrix rhusiopathiae TaxID=1648 RepID=UPI0023AECA54|nr:helix-turn-helix transcriptional regulator [Erysipelothrix rhusiopathiae]MDE8044279.1 helix-turn-helix transcriptional regulator [Erysipelothrix rhusiopathiae]MDE8069232.1 helix-turn-helix transcriptional regulator [Erysipelothrix rhusiopathiae]MDE8115209.1 helix-turn-helix transcriptional regulator [Erysipelothrix rhusiopathiae]MDE8207847.1 helix-turn-helix transcriptional regulator [Erysipelothrix rhusiopathiae]MDE8275930.1 helix-turn-helix transcriptional regulator [Erysipelothrix rhusio
MEKELIGFRLRELRNGKGITREEVSIATGITLRAIEGYERGERVPRDEVKLKLADFYQKSVQEIFFDK